MARLAIIAGQDAGHALPAVGLAAALARRGHVVRLVTAQEHAATARRHGLAVEPLPPLPPDPRDHDLGHRLWGRAVALAPRVAELLEGTPVDAVVTDTLVPGGGLAAQLVGAAWVELIPHHLPDPAPDLPPVGLGRRRARTPLRRADDRHIHRAQLRSVETGAAQALAAARAVGLDGPEPPIARLLATLPALERARAHWPATAHVVGSLAVDPALLRLRPPAGDDPLVVVTDSTATGVHRSIGRVAIDALADVPVRLVVTSGSLEPRDEPGLTVGIGPHGPLLDGAALAVGPGGGGFVSKAVAAGVPMVLVPLAGDQREAAARLRDTAAGRILPPSRLTVRQLRWAVTRHLADRRAAAAARVLARQAASLGPDVAAALVERVAAGDRPVARGPDEHLPDPDVAPTR